MQDPWSRPRTATSAALLADFAAERGVPAAVVLRGTGLDAAQLRDPYTEINAGQELTLMRNVVRELGDTPGLGLELGSRYHATTHGVWGFAVISSPTISAALDVAVRYAGLTFSFCDISIEYEGPHRRVVFDDSHVPADVRRFHLERDLAATLTVQLDLIPVQLAARRLDVALGEEQVYLDFARAAHTEVIFSQPRTTVVIDADTLNVPLPQANPHVAHMCEQQCAELLMRQRERLGVSGQVRELLIRRGALTAQHDVAAGLGLSERTLRRRLATEGTTFRELTGETFGVLTAELLGAGLTVEQIAGRLGYSSASALTYAFTSWRGVTPGKYGRERRAG